MSDTFMEALAVGIQLNEGFYRFCAEGRGQGRRPGLITIGRWALISKCVDFADNAQHQDIMLGLEPCPSFCASFLTASSLTALP